MNTVNREIMIPVLFGETKVIAEVHYKKAHYVASIHPLDKRGYRCIISPEINQFNLNPTEEISRDERRGLALLTQLVTEAYARLQLVPEVTIRTKKQAFSDGEMCFSHVHVYGRGDPEKCYVENIKLDGPPQPLEFAVFPFKEGEQGNDNPVPWSKGEITKVTLALRAQVEKIKTIYEEQGLQIRTSWASL